MILLFESVLKVFFSGNDIVCILFSDLFCFSLLIRNEQERREK
jgi:hypothetical protein